MIIAFGENSLDKLEELLLSKYLLAKYFILVDTNTSEHCLPHLLETCESLQEAEILEIPDGEDSKCLEIVQQLWGGLLDSEADRESVLLNLGGGVVTDIGGFVAATFKRGIDFINIPTSLLGMTDAAYGGKTGINFHQLKNQIGTFTHPVGIFYDTVFLETLPNDHLRSGTAEMLKHGLIADAALYHQLKAATAGFAHDFDALLEKSLHIKMAIVEEDQNEKHVRKKLNFGHTFGHAFESFCAENGHHIHHGDAVAAGMIAESYLSAKKANLPALELEDISHFLTMSFPKVPFEKEDIPTLLQYMNHDKKMKYEQLQLPLLKAIGSCEIFDSVEVSELSEAFLYYLDSK
ncbi:MAG: 3-dehydroquinate synthase [Schleiferiaceae bacterium]|nr:3-dehydroquinate synthase [Schleiferiaceae bacterium]